MPNATFTERSRKGLDDLREQGTYKSYKHLEGPMAAHSPMAETGGEVIVLSSNDYLGFASHPDVVKGGHDALSAYGAGTASVRFICGTMAIHKKLEEKIAAFHRQEAALTFSSCWAANTGLFPTICAPDDVFISDALNHASIIDGGRLLKKGVEKDVYGHSDMANLEEILQKHQNAPVRFIVTDGVFSMEGDIAKLPEIVALAEKYNAVLIVDDSHGVGVMGKNGRGTAEHFGLEDKVDVITGTLGKALGGAAGGYVAGPAYVTEQLVQAARPHIFSNAISPATAGSALAALDLLEKEPARAESLRQKTAYFRAGLIKLGYSPLEGDSAIVPIIIGDTAKAMAVADAMLEEGVFVTGFGFPVVPEGEARVRAQISEGLSRQDLDKTLAAFEKVGNRLELL